MQKRYKFSVIMRILHRYIGFFMAGIMAVYAISGVLLVYRDTDFLKKEVVTQKTVKPGLDLARLREETKMRNLELTDTITTWKFKEGFYDPATGELKIVKKELPYLLGKFTQLHKAKSAEKLSPLNVVFGVSLFFFVVSSFWMFAPRSSIFRKGLIYTALGLVMAVLLVVFG